MPTAPVADCARPVVALMGEFSAGKSTLANLLLGEGLSPVRVTATQLPPIWYAYGEPGAERTDHDGNITPLDLDRIGSVSIHDTAFIKVYLDADVLDLMDIIDMPGISDPNLSPEIWQRVIPHADSVIWCSHATQAWRQSEAATWAEMPAHLHETSLLLLTRFDKILTESDRTRVVSRVKAETEGLFSGIFPISLLRAAEAGDDRASWEASGAEAFTQKLLDVVFNVVPGRRETAQASPESGRGHGPAAPGDAPAHVDGDSAGIAPKRVVPRSRGEGQRQRLPRSALGEIAF
ncbi:dynamin family protein [Tropicimonas isoalkanivorans]|uniref:Dynamin family protein n=1 Tax=Tropicimonas isoalkanivorans TaxID=441112 RepID=A0A1I1KLU5_9RHOB|nr:dynamin family protein [Tropicimonas isoalkanivorans]SFC58390.1 Dynamin family protein [Tropicimonas isoalkanivorans]